MKRVDRTTVAGLFANRSRAAMLDVLFDGADHPLGSLARAAGVMPSTASEDLTYLEECGIVISKRAGRRRLVRIASPAVAIAYEALGELSGETEMCGSRPWTHGQELRAGRTCYDHLAGRLGVAITDAALTAGALATDFTLGSAAGHWFASLGVDLDLLRDGRRPLLRVCIDWTERCEHLAGGLGAAICSAVLDARWAIKRPFSRALRLTQLGQTKLHELQITVGAG